MELARLFCADAKGTKRQTLGVLNKDTPSEIEGKAKVESFARGIRGPNSPIGLSGVSFFEGTSLQKTTICCFFPPQQKGKEKEKAHRNLLLSPFPGTIYYFPSACDKPCAQRPLLSSVMDQGTQLLCVQINMKPKKGVPKRSLCSELIALLGFLLICQRPTPYFQERTSIPTHPHGQGAG